MQINPIGNTKETRYLAAVHKAILQLNKPTPEQKAKSAQWLCANGFERA